MNTKRKRIRELEAEVQRLSDELCWQRDRSDRWYDKYLHLRKALDAKPKKRIGW